MDLNFYAKENRRLILSEARDFGKRGGVWIFCQSG